MFRPVVQGLRVCSTLLSRKPLCMTPCRRSNEGLNRTNSVPQPSGPGSLSAAVAAAAHGVLVGLYPGQQAALDATYDAYINGLTDSAELVAVGEAVGEQAAADLLTQYRAAPAPPLPPFTGGTEPGEWRPTPPTFSPGAFEFLAYTVPFTLDDSSQFRPEPPPLLTSITYLREYNEVKLLGALNSTTRTPAQTDLARFWSGNFIAQWNEAIRGIAGTHIFDIGDSARLFALASLAAADAAITVWDSKYASTSGGLSRRFRKGTMTATQGRWARRTGRRSSSPRLIPITLPAQTASPALLPRSCNCSS